MLLKCRYLSQFTLADLSKNASAITSSIDKCPFMVHARRTLATGVLNNDSNTSQIQPEKNQTCTAQLTNQRCSQDAKCCNNSINCPFFKNGGVDLKSVIVKKDLDIDSNEAETRLSGNNNQAVKRTFNAMETQSKMMKHNSSFEQSAKPSLQTNTDSLFDYEKFFGNKIEAKKKDGSYRYFKKVIRHAASFPNVEEHTPDAVKKITIWCSNDYLGLGRHPYVQSRVTEAVMKYGAGSGGTRNISGSTPLHDKLESELAKLHQKESALLFTSCYVANDTCLYTMAKMLPQCHILSDAGNHASMIQGIRNSAIPKTIFRHNDYEHLESILQKLPVNTPKIVAFESVHSMDGSICDIDRMCDITHKYGGIAYIDEVHAVGLYGQNGAGVGERDNVLHKMDIITGTLGKAFGNIGGYIAGSARFVDTMRSYGSGFIFTTSLPPSVAAGALAAIEVSRSDEGRELRAKHQYYAKMVKSRLIEAGLPVMNTPSHIVPVMVGNPKVAAEICDILLKDHGIYIQSINYPTVARGTERLRIVPNPHHTAEMVDNLVESLIDVWVKLGLEQNKSQSQMKLH